ncbi:hypothetical protein G4G27_08170 [Sphingomonas sp. So64.6b]|nr:hypothetical protein [Sphingomonas sp. So64.6b]QNA83965.1 hypothetical protein G4G27_08170 [Sphingomonas sp. So64.6b]
MSNLKMDFRQPHAGLADHFSFFYHFQQSDDRFEAVKYLLLPSPSQR